MLANKDKIIVTGAAGLVGHNLVYQLCHKGFRNIVAIDKNEHNLQILKKYNPDVTTILADLAKSGFWYESFVGSQCLINLQAQIVGKTREIFERNTIRTTKLVLEVALKVKIPYIVHISSSVVKSVVSDYYTETKKIQEQIVIESGLNHCILRPNLMFGWFDPKHLGWLSRFMERIPIFPIPGDGRYIRQPLYVQDFCKIIIYCAVHQPYQKIYDIVGQERIYYLDIINTIKRCKELKTPNVHIPYGLFIALLKIYAMFTKNPPFTADQLNALSAGDEFRGVNMEQEFGITPTPFELAVRETFCDERYSTVFISR